MPTAINRSEVMRTAWQVYRHCYSECERKALAKGFRHPVCRKRWSNALKAAWSICRERARVAALDAAARAAEARAALQARLLDLETSECGHRELSAVSAIHSTRMGLAALGA
ncbi:hypothetical protein [Chthonobacter albigriseus]|uniref:hypothetical protein n=1 Tax=Chthonobacter albigriseus TaxID=1683161 RepID=UPI0015EEFDD7|nr:hypothetical protein [Chthonobacter albigriseus]